MTFAYRLAYVRWLRDIGRTPHGYDREFAAEMGIGEKWLAKWKFSHHAPEGRREYVALQRGLAPYGISADWLYDGIGDPPEPDLWARWASHFADGG